MCGEEEELVGWMVRSFEEGLGWRLEFGLGGGISWGFMGNGHVCLDLIERENSNENAEMTTTYIWTVIFFGNSIANRQVLRKRPWVLLLQSS